MRRLFALACAVSLLSGSRAWAEDAVPVSCIDTPGIVRPAASDIPNPAKFFPPVAQLLGEEGDLLLEFTVKTNGRIADPKVGKTSGYPRLDAAALKMVQEWRYKPAALNGDRIACRNKAVVKWTIPPGLGRASPQRMIVPDAATWPAGTYEKGIEGVTTVRANVAPDGSIKTQVMISSGMSVLDKDAVARVLARSDLKPEMQDGVALGALYTFHVIWSQTPVTLSKPN